MTGRLRRLRLPLSAPAQECFEPLPADGAGPRAGKALRIDAQVEPESVEQRDEADGDLLCVDPDAAIFGQSIQHRREQFSQPSIGGALDSLDRLIRSRERPVGNVAAHPLVSRHLTGKVGVDEGLELLRRGYRGIGKNTVQALVELPSERPIRFDDQLVLAIKMVAQQSGRDARSIADLAHAGPMGPEPREAIERCLDQALPAFARPETPILPLCVGEGWHRITDYRGA